MSSNHTPLCQLLILIFGCHFFQSMLACFRRISFTSCGQNTLMSTATCTSNSKVCHCDDLNAQLAQNCSCKSSHLPPSLHLENLLPPHLLLLSLPSCVNIPSSQKSVAMVESSSSTTKVLTSMKRESGTDSFGQNARAKWTWTMYTPSWS